MATPAALSITVNRNAPYPDDDFVLKDKASGDPIDLTGYLIEMQVRLYEGAPGDPLIDLTSTAASGNRIDIIDAANGRFRPVISQATHETLPLPGKLDTSDKKSTADFAHDIAITPPAGLKRIRFAGIYRVRTGVTV